MGDPNIPPNGDPAPDRLNQHQQRHLLVSCRHIDKLLAEIEGVLTASASRSPFPRYRSGLLPVSINAQLRSSLEFHERAEPLRAFIERLTGGGRATGTAADIETALFDDLRALGESTPSATEGTRT